jgi:hypothetical protein
VVGRLAERRVPEAGLEPRPAHWEQRVGEALQGRLAELGAEVVAPCPAPRQGRLAAAPGPPVGAFPLRLSVPEHPALVVPSSHPSRVN